MQNHNLTAVEMAIEEIKNLPQPTITNSAALSKFKPVIKIALQQGHKLPYLLNIINKLQTKYNGAPFEMQQLEKYLDSTNKKEKHAADTSNSDNK